MNQKQRFKPPSTKLGPVSQQIYDFFLSRGISQSTVNAYKIASDENGNIVFPFYDGGELVYVKHRKPKSQLEETEKRFKEWQDPGTKPILFGMDECVFTEPLYIT